MPTLTVAFIACSGSGAPKPMTAEHYFENFKTVVGSADKDGYKPYWLGREFVAGGLTFRGPDVSDLPGDRVDGGGVKMSYDAGLRGGGGVILDVLVYSAAAWQKARGRQEGPATKFVTVAGQDDVKLSVLSAGTRPINQLRLQLLFGETTVLAIAYSGGPATPGGADVNPLVDEATLISVMEKIRPYQD